MSEKLLNKSVAVLQEIIEVKNQTIEAVQSESAALRERNAEAWRMVNEKTCRIAELEASNQRLHDLARFCRHELFDQGLVDDDEFASLVEDHPAVARLEGYDKAIAKAKQKADRALSELAEARAKLNTPEIVDFMAGVPLEAAHQRERWGTDHDAGKTAADWFWLVGYLAGKALHSQASGNDEKALHHVITTAAALANWHSAILGKTNMRPGIMPPDAARAAIPGEPEK